MIALKQCFSNCALFVILCLAALATIKVAAAASHYSAHLKGIPEYYDEVYFERIERYLFDIEAKHGEQNISELLRDELITDVHTKIINDLINRQPAYDTLEDLEASGGPQANQELCLSQLSQLVARSDAMKRKKFKSTDIEMSMLLDSFGRVPFGLFEGNTNWLGSYEECSRLTIKLDDGTRSATRYCLGSVKLIDWPSVSKLDSVLFLKQAVCLPKSCDSINYKNKFQLVQQLAEFHAREVDMGAMNLTDLYCLPDEQSTLRMWWRSKPTVITVSLLSAWTLFVLYATIKSFSIVDNKEGSLLKSLSIVHNLRALFRTENKRSREKQTSSAETINGKYNSVQEFKKPFVVDLRSIEGVKVICMIYIILSHVLALHTIISRSIWSLKDSSAFYIYNMGAAFSVNGFFTVTGLLTSYLLLKKEKIIKTITKPIGWFIFALNRYLRIMPIYVIAIAYTKYLAKYLGSGPLWDYGTTAATRRKACAQESWLWHLLFVSNFKTSLAPCLPPAWYLSNDFQFFLLTPIFLTCLHKRPKFGVGLLLLLIVAGSASTFLNVYTTDTPDFRPVVRIYPFAFRMVATVFSESYTRPQFRIPAYLFGLLVGFFLNKLEQDEATKAALIKQIELEAKNWSQLSSQQQFEMIKISQGPISKWSHLIRPIGLTVSAFTISLCFLTSVIGIYIPFDKYSARIATSLFLPSGHLLFAIGTGIYLLLSATGQGFKRIDRFLSMSFWKPLSRLGLCALLINCEVIVYCLQIRSIQMQFDTISINILNVWITLLTYLCSIPLYVIFEAPAKAISNRLIAALSSTNKLAKNDNHNSIRN